VVNGLGCEVVRLGDPLLVHGNAGEDLTNAPIGDQRSDVGWVHQGVELDELYPDEIGLCPESAQEGEELARREAIWFGGAGAGGVRWVESSGIGSSSESGAAMMAVPGCVTPRRSAAAPS